MSKRLSPRVALSTTLPLFLSLLFLTVVCLLAQDPAKSLPMEGATTDPAAHAKIGLKPPADPKLSTLFLVGDSTVRNGHADGAGGQWGWGEPLVDLFDTSKINVDNRAIGGRSSRSYIMENQWAETLAFVKPGDIILFQWGHNDDGPLDDPARARGTLHGIGDETKEIDNPILKIHETVHTYGWYLRKYVEDTKARGAIPIICSSIPRKTWKDGKIVRNAANYGGWARQVAEQDTSRAGAELNAESVVAGLKALPHDPVAAYFSTKGKAITPYVE